MSGKVQLPHLDLMCLTACQLRCTGCTNGMGLWPMQVWPAEDVERDITAAAKVMHAGVGCLLGGEPTSHPEIVRLMRFTRESGICDRVQVLTNGLRLHRMKPEFWEELQELKISIYPGKTPQENIELAKQKAREHGFAIDYYDVASDPFRAVLTKTERTYDNAKAVYRGCWYRTFTRKIERGYFYRCCTSPTISELILDLPQDADGIKLESLTPEALTEFLERDEPMNSCFRCHGNMGPRLEQWTETRGDKDEWLRQSAV